MFATSGKAEIKAWTLGITTTMNVNRGFVVNECIESEVATIPSEVIWSVVIR